MAEFRVPVRFSLRVLLAAVTLFCIWLGWEGNRVRQRTIARQWITEHKGVWNSFADPSSQWEALRWIPLIAENEAKVSISRRLLRDTAVMFIAFPEGAVAEQDIERLRDLFPEAFVLEVQIPPR
jgi:hypothetical protein